MLPAVNTALSGLNAAETRLQVSANNIANQFSTSKLADGSTTPYVPERVDQVSLSQGGVAALVSQQNIKNTSVTGDADGNSDASAVPNDPTNDLISANTAAYDFKANLKTLQVQDKVTQSLLNIIS